MVRFAAVQLGPVYHRRPAPFLTYLEEMTYA
jgi:hypothetical protein